MKFTLSELLLADLLLFPDDYGRFLADHHYSEIEVRTKVYYFKNHLNSSLFRLFKTISRSAKPYQDLKDTNWNY